MGGTVAWCIILKGSMASINAYLFQENFPPIDRISFLRYARSAFRAGKDYWHLHDPINLELNNDLIHKIPLPSTKA